LQNHRLHSKVECKFKSFDIGKPRGITLVFDTPFCPTWYEQTTIQSLHSILQKDSRRWINMEDIVTNNFSQFLFITLRLVTFDSVWVKGANKQMNSRSNQAIKLLQIQIKAKHWLLLLNRMLCWWWNYITFRNDLNLIDFSIVNFYLLR
jgi:hypothetical protein